MVPSRMPRSGLVFPATETTQTYLHAHLALKEAALAKLKPYRRGRPIRFRANDRLLVFLEAL
jgi:integrase/recombinase XerD